jgi:hypothetical protein
MPTIALNDLPREVKDPFVAKEVATQEVEERIRFKVSCPGSELIVIGWKQAEDGFLIPEDRTLVTVTPFHYFNPFRRRIREEACDRFVDAHSDLGLRSLTYYEIVGDHEPEQEAEQDVHGNTH